MCCCACAVLVCSAGRDHLGERADPHPLMHSDLSPEERRRRTGGVCAACVRVCVHHDRARSPCTLDVNAARRAHAPTHTRDTGGAHPRNTVRCLAPARAAHSRTSTQLRNNNPASPRTIRWVHMQTDSGSGVLDIITLRVASI
eukprot:4893065-Prymnesium_polylepis.1